MCPRYFSPLCQALQKLIMPILLICPGTSHYRTWKGRRQLWVPPPACTSAQKLPISATAALLPEILKPPANNNLNLSSSTKNQEHYVSSSFLKLTFPSSSNAARQQHQVPPGLWPSHPVPPVTLMQHGSPRQAPQACSHCYSSQPIRCSSVRLH